MIRRAVLLAAIAALAASACVGRRTGGPERTARVASYRASIETGSGEGRRFRLLLWVGEPGRLHAEALSPSGWPEVVLDAGGGRLSVSVPRRGRAYVGEGSAAIVERLLGAPLSIEDLTRAILGGEVRAAPGVEIERIPAAGGGLPERMVIRAGGRGLRLVRRGVRTAALGEGTGTGAPPAGLAVLPIESLGPDDLPGLPETAQGGTR